MRLAHVESAYGVPQFLAKVFANCRRTSLRGLGPPTGAAGLPIHMVHEDEDYEPAGIDVGAAVSAYVVAEGWLLGG